MKRERWAILVLWVYLAKKVRRETREIEVYQAKKVRRETRENGVRLVSIR